MGIKIDKTQAWTVVAISAIMDFLGILAIPVFLMVGCNVIDYVTGIIASKYRKEQISSYKGIRGITKKVCMWILVLIGGFIDILITYTIDTIGIDIELPFLVATIVAVWIVTNEMISILENIVDIGVELPPFLLPLVKRIRGETEAIADNKIDKTM